MYSRCMYPLYVGVNTLIQDLVYSLYCICRKQVGHCHDKLVVFHTSTTKGPFSHSRSHMSHMHIIMIDCTCMKLEN